MEHIHTVCRARGVPLVIHFFTYAMAEPWIAKGVRFVLFGNDRLGIGDRMKTDLEHLKTLAGA